MLNNISGHDRPKKENLTFQRQRAENIKYATLNMLNAILNENNVLNHSKANNKLQDKLLVKFIKCNNILCTAKMISG